MTNVNNFTYPFNFTGNVTVPALDHDQVDAFLYIIVVIMFYACAIVILMIKYIQGEKNEAHYRYYYEEYVKREEFVQRNRRESISKLKYKFTQETYV